jgi:hypothetical protein
VQITKLLITGLCFSLSLCFFLSWWKSQQTTSRVSAPSAVAYSYYSFLCELLLQEEYEIAKN